MSSINCFKSHFRGKWWNSRFSCAFSHFVVIEYILMGHSINYSTMLKSFGQSGEFNWFSLVLSCLSRKLCKNLVCSYFEGKSIHHWYQWEIDKKKRKHAMESKQSRTNREKSVSHNHHSIKFLFFFFFHKMTNI